MTLLIQFISNQYYSFVFSTLRFLKLSFHKTKMTPSIVKAKIALDIVNAKDFIEGFGNSRENVTVLTPFLKGGGRGQGSF